MFVIPGLVALLIFMVGRPFDLSEALQGLPLLYLFCGLAILGYAVDLRLRLAEFRPGRTLFWVVGFFLWACLTVLIRAPDQLVPSVIQLAIITIVYLLLAQGIRSFKAFEVITATLLACSLWISVISTQMGLQPTECIQFGPGETRATSMGRPTGQPCNLALDCRSGGEGFNWGCEHAGWFGVTSIEQRVRYVGTLQDPNEVAMVVSIALPMAVAFYQRRRNLRRLLLLLTTLGLSASTVHFSGSRGGLLVMLTVLGVYAVQRFGIKRMLQVGVPLLVPALLFLLTRGGGREDAEASTFKRLGCLRAGVDMVLEWPVLGAGFGQFTAHHTQTAHNSYLLAAGELGFLGMILWSTILYLSIKTMLVATQHCKTPEASVARIWGVALSTSLLGLSVGTFFLSFTYHNVTWIFFGLASAFFAAVQRHDVAWQVHLSWRDGVLLVSGNAFIVLAVYIYTSIELGI